MILNGEGIATCKDEINAAFSAIAAPMRVHVLNLKHKMDLL